MGNAHDNAWDVCTIAVIYTELSLPFEPSKAVVCTQNH